MLFALISLLLTTPANAAMCAAGTPAFLSGVVINANGTVSIGEYEENGNGIFTDVTVQFLSHTHPFIFWVTASNQVFGGLEVRFDSWATPKLTKPLGWEVIIISNENILLSGQKGKRLPTLAENFRMNEQTWSNGPCFSNVGDGMWAVTFNSNTAKER